MKINAECECCCETCELLKFEYEFDPFRTTFQDLYELIDADMAKVNLDITFFTRIPHLVIEREEREPLENATIQEVIQANNLRDDLLYVYITYGGIGVSEDLEGGIILEIREREDPRHKPHIHVSMKGIGDVAILIGSTEEACKIVAGEQNWGKFKRKDKKALVRMIVDNYENFLSFYNDYRERYIKPKSIIFLFRGKTYNLHHGSAVYMD